ncbi:MAG: hypothetical protein FVQ82_08855 [Planctomycetes bacterium]|nr:hypothetical protein [Planctomycetota bacterium]
MENLLRKLANRARLETMPDLDVVDIVMSRISAQPVSAVGPYDKPFVWIASLSTAAAIAIGTFAIYAYFAWSNPLSEMSETIAWVL